LPVKAAAMFVLAAAFAAHLVHAGWWQSQAISASSAPASLHCWLQYFSPAAGIQTHGRCAHLFFLELSLIVDLLAAL